MSAPTNDTCPTTSLTVDTGPERGLRLALTAHLGDGAVSLHTVAACRRMVGMVTGIGATAHRAPRITFEDPFAVRLGDYGEALTRAAEAFYLGVAAISVTRHMIGEFELPGGSRYRLYADDRVRAVSICRIAPTMETRKRFLASGLHYRRPRFFFPANWTREDRHRARTAVRVSRRAALTQRTPGC
ncbi:hypothetical protein [Glycomyces xiaoerkulensis]|uniref:hypothetical protein n=1 Tax=Glycomyces xiaoerkulensis TaxID=2038139 RepID=UPI0012FFF3E0|nr:hypothetical protein [Glycomyces xiaoerkulensis]